MTKLLKQVLRHVEQLPDERQDDAAHVLLTMLESDAEPYDLTEEQLAELELSISEADTMQFASEKDLERALYRPWP
jgi:hypothetical protein